MFIHSLIDKWQGKKKYIDYSSRRDGEKKTMLIEGAADWVTNRANDREPLNEETTKKLKENLVKNLKGDYHMDNHRFCSVYLADLFDQTANQIGLKDGLFPSNTMMHFYFWEELGKYEVTIRERAENSEKLEEGERTIFPKLQAA